MDTNKMKNGKPKKVSYYRNRADGLFQKYLCNKNKRCECCGQTVSCHHHFFPKSVSSSLRYDEDNMIPVCVGCHLGFHSARASQFIAGTILRRGEEWYKKLLVKKYILIKTGIKYYKKIIEQYE